MERKDQIVNDSKELQNESLNTSGQTTIGYRLTCSESGNGLSHYIMYGDIPEEAEINE